MSDKEKRKVVLTFHTSRSVEESDNRFAMIDDSAGSSAQTFVVEVGKELIFAEPLGYDHISVTIDQVLED